MNKTWFWIILQLINIGFYELDIYGQYALLIVFAVISAYTVWDKDTHHDSIHKIGNKTEENNGR